MSFLAFLRGLAAALTLGLCFPAWAGETQVVMTGTLHAGDNQTYRELPFTVPAGVGKITVDVSWDSLEKGTYLVLGLYDPERNRGWGGAIKPHFVVADGFASPSYLPGPIVPGQWRLSLAVASIRPGVTSPYTVKITLATGPEAQRFSDTPLRTGAGWYRGDLHSHTGHSDAACRSLSGAATPCPLFLSLQAAVDHKLDFLVVTDHNVSSHVADMGNLAAYFDTLLLIPGREMTTQNGHFNLLGITDFVDFRLGPKGIPTINGMFDAAKGTGALVSINHPEIPTGEACLGCGWNAPDTDYGRVQSVEVANGGIAADQGGFDDGAGSGVAFWEAQLSRGYHLTGVGGSDNHDAVDGRKDISPVGAQSPVGFPATVVHADALSQPAILNGIRSGRVFIDLEGAHPGRVLDMAASAGGATAVMGATLARDAAAPIVAHIHVAGAKGAHIDLIADGQGQKLIRDPVLRDDDQTVDVTFPAGQDIHWFRADVRAADGRRILIGNPIYVAPKG
ncbi:MAG: CehA/McbA family metallohydrolase [Azospirillaceae bacterium]|nr:CehA/McbA family metallohydrolase [Azospirillaceae bacterium]